MSDSANSGTGACQAPLSMEFLRQYWSGYPSHSPGDLPDPKIKPSACIYHLSPPGNPRSCLSFCEISLSRIQFCSKYMESCVFHSFFYRLSIDIFLNFVNLFCISNLNDLLLIITIYMKSLLNFLYT